MSRAVVVIVEDDPDVASFLETTLNEVCETRVAADGVAARRMLDQLTPDLVVLDIRLPHVSGVELCQMIRSDEHLRRTPILVVTGFPESPDIEIVRDMGVHHILAKPVTARRLMEAIQAILPGASTRLGETDGDHALPSGGS